MKNGQYIVRSFKTDKEFLESTSALVGEILHVGVLGSVSVIDLISRYINDIQPEELKAYRVINKLEANTVVDIYECHSHTEALKFARKLYNQAPDVVSKQDAAFAALDAVVINPAPNPKPRNVFRKGQHVVCKHHELKHGGTGNGDLIVGVVESVRSCGDVLLINLLKNTRSVKSAEVLARKNVVVSKREAMRVVELSSHTQNMADIRKFAVEIGMAARAAKPTEPASTEVETVDSAQVKTYGYGYIKLIQTWGDDSSVIEAARMSTNAGFKGWGTDAKPGDEKLLKYLYDHKHHTPFEMVGLTLEVSSPIFVFREWQRHRVPFSYNEMSGRYTPLPSMDYVPTVERLMMPPDNKNTQAKAVGGAPVLTIEAAERFRSELFKHYAEAQRIYEQALADGVPKELARVHLSVGRYSRMRVSSNLRGWFSFLQLRMHPTAQWEIRQDANAIAKMAQAKFPRCMALFLGSQKAGVEWSKP